MEIAQRVSIVEGKNPILLIAPGGPDEKNTDILTEMLAEKSNCFAVINWGWKKASTVSCRDSKADCNNVFHLVDVVYDEFLDPIFRFKNRISRNHHTIYQFVIQGVTKNDLPPNVDIVCGEGGERKSCQQWFRDYFSFIAGENGLHVYLARPTSCLSGGHKKHLNQLFAQIYPDERVQSLQLEITEGLRDSKIDTELFADFLTKVLIHVPTFTKTRAANDVPRGFAPRTI